MDGMVLKWVIEKKSHKTVYFLKLYFVFVFARPTKIHKPNESLFTGFYILYRKSDKCVGCWIRTSLKKKKTILLTA